MPHLIQTNFTAGILSQRLWGRVDLGKYYNGLRTLENFFVHPHGGLTKRSGFEFIAEVKDSARKTRLLPFMYSGQDGYVLEFGHQTLRFYRSGGLVLNAQDQPYELTTPYAEEDLPGLKYAQTADVVFLTHPKHAPRKLTRQGHASWTLAAISFTAQPAEWGTNNWPAAVNLYQQRTVWAGVPSAPHKVWCSMTGDFYNFTSEIDPATVRQDWNPDTQDWEDVPGTGTTSDESGLEWSLVANQVNAAHWITVSKQVMIGTVGGIWKLWSGSGSQAMTPTQVDATLELTGGAEDIMPVKVGGVILYVKRYGRALGELAYRFDSDGYVAPDLTLLAEHLTRQHRVTDLAYAARPHSVVWAVREDGLLLGLTYLREHDVVGWHAHATDGAFESVAVIPGEDRDEVWAVVRREIGGQSRRYVERLAAEFDHDTASRDAFFVDSGLTWRGEPADEISGLGHLEGKTVAVLADGAAHPDRVVENGAVRLNVEAETVHVGLPYAGEFTTLPLEVKLPDGTSQGRLKRVVSVFLRASQTLGLKVGSGGENMEEVHFRQAADSMDAPPPVFSGDIEKDDFPGEYETDPRVVVRHDRPLPLTVNALAVKVDVGEY